MLHKNLSLFVLGLALSFAATGLAATPTDLAVQAALSKDLSRFPNVAVKVDDRMVLLTGSVQSYLEKQAAERKARSYGGVTDVISRLNVEGPRGPDEQLAQKLARKLVYDRSTLN